MLILIFVFVRITVLEKADHRAFEVKTHTDGRAQPNRISHRKKNTYFRRGMNNSYAIVLDHILVSRVKNNTICAEWRENIVDLNTKIFIWLYNLQHRCPDPPQRN